MSANLRLAIGMLGSLAVGAAGAALWLRAPAAVDPPLAPPSAVAPAPAVAAAVAASATDMPVAPTLVHSPALQGDPAGEFVVGVTGDAAKALDMAALAVGSADAGRSLRRATYRLTLGGAQRRSVTVLADAELGVVLRDDESGLEQGRIGGVCYTRRQGAVLGCRRGEVLLLQGLHWMHRGQLVRPLSEAPWRIGATGAQSDSGRVLNKVELEVPGAAVNGAVAALATLDPRGRRLLRLEISAARVATPGITAGSTEVKALEPGTVGLEFSEPRSFSGMLLAGTLRLTSTLDGPRSRDVTIHVIDVTPGADVPAKAPALALPKGLQRGAQLVATAMVFPLDGHDQVLARLSKLAGEVLTSGVVDQFEVVEAMAPLGAAAGEGMQLWLLPRWPSALALQGVQPHVAKVATAAKVVGRFAQVPLAQVPAEAAAVLAEVEAAGHKPSAGQRTLVSYLDHDPETDRVTVAVEVPVD